MAEVVFVIHAGQMALVLFGWLLPFPYYYLYLADLSLTFLNQLIWRSCFLTAWEFYFRHIADPSIKNDRYFLTYYSDKYFPSFVTDGLVDRASLVFLSVSLAFAAFRLAGIL
ncbi:MAG: hypothetical protein KGI70_00715 [Patescibacteria group bacterium]|nr:hypothetical protein [Patescibacteria group bacterium]